MLFEEVQSHHRQRDSTPGKDLRLAGGIAWVELSSSLQEDEEIIKTLFRETTVDHNNLINGLSGKTHNLYSSGKMT
jgi:hypothetical protein